MRATTRRLYPLVRGAQGIRGEDAWGAGYFGAPRGKRTHRGVDIVAQKGEDILAPMDGEIVRKARPYDDDERYSGLLLAGSGRWAGMEIKVFYIEPRPPGPVRQGDVIGRAQDIAAKYPGITPHVHIEVWRGGAAVDPAPLLRLA